MIPSSNEESCSPAEQELMTLIGSVLNETAAPADARRLDEILLRDAGARRSYRRYINLHAALHSRFALSESRQARVETILEERGAISRTNLFSTRMVRISVAAILIISTGWLGAQYLIHDTSDKGLNSAPTEVVSMGHLSKISGARWGEARDALAIDASFNAGPVNLSEGLAEITLTNGVRVVLEAPVRFDLETTHKLSLWHGRLVAYVPPEARGFAIETPHSRVIDLGTEFGVGVDDGGETEVQVFRGELLTQAKGSPDSAQNQHLLAGKAVIIDASAVSRGIPYQPQRFVRMFPEDPVIKQPGGPLYNQSHLGILNVVPAPEKVAIDGNLSDWDRSGAFHAECMPPYNDNHHVDGSLMYDSRFLYIGAHVADPAPMLSKMDPDVNPQQYSWQGGSVILRLATDPKLGWPLKAMGPAERSTQHPDYGQRPEDINENLVHLTMWYYQPSGKARLQLSFGMDFHGEITQPLSKIEGAAENKVGWDGVFVKDPDGRGYTLEYAVPWALLNAASKPPQAGDVLAANWTVHWSDKKGELSRGYLTEITNPAIQPFHFLNGSAWGKAIFMSKGNSSLPERVR